MAWLWPKDGQWQDTREMDSNWEGEKVRSKNYLVKNNDERAGDGSNMEWITGQSSGQNWVAMFDLMSQSGSRNCVGGWVWQKEKKNKENLDFSIIFCLDNEQNAIEYNFWLHLSLSLLMRISLAGWRRLLRLQSK